MYPGGRAREAGTGPVWRRSGFVARAWAAWQFPEAELARPEETASRATMPRRRSGVPCGRSGSAKSDDTEDRPHLPEFRIARLPVGSHAGLRNGHYQEVVSNSGPVHRHF